MISLKTRFVVSRSPTFNSPSLIWATDVIGVVKEVGEVVSLMSKFGRQVRQWAVDC